MGATCTALTSTPEIDGAKVKIRWRGLNPSNRLKTVATDRGLVATVSWDDPTSALVVVTEPIDHGAFAGTTITLHLGLDGVARFESGCTTGAVLGNKFGTENLSTVDVP